MHDLFSILTFLGASCPRVDAGRWLIKKMNIMKKYEKLVGEILDTAITAGNTPERKSAIDQLEAIGRPYSWAAIDRASESELPGSLCSPKDVNQAMDHQS